MSSANYQAEYFLSSFVFASSTFCSAYKIIRTQNLFTHFQICAAFWFHIIVWYTVPQITSRRNAIKSKHFFSSNHFKIAFPHIQQMLYDEFCTNYAFLRLITHFCILALMSKNWGIIVSLEVICLAKISYYELFMHMYILMK